MKKIGIYLTFIAIGNLSFAQLPFDKIIEAGAADAETYLQGYMEPAFVGFGLGFNSGWYNTAKPHKLFGFDITAGVSLAEIPDENKFFTFDNADYTSMQLTNGNTAQLPTFAGPNLNADDIAELTIPSTEDGVPDLRLSGITGIGIEENDVYPFESVFVPAPFAQIGIGLIKNTEVKLRIVPEQNITGGHTFNSLGFGVMHDVKQWIPGMKLLPFDLSAFFAFNQFGSTFVIDEDAGQTAELNLYGTTYQAIVSKKLAILTVYAGVGFMTSGSQFRVLGDYEAGPTVLTDPVDFSFETSSARANIGARLKLLILTVHAEYAIQTYNTLTVGLGVSVR